MTATADCIATALKNQGYSGTIPDMEWAWLNDQTGLGTTRPGMWYALLTGMGYSGALNDMKVESWVAMGAPSSAYPDAKKWFWCVGGGTYGPTVQIVQNGISYCDYVPAGTCTAATTYTANDSGFTNPANSWAWTLEPPVAGVVITNGTTKTCTVTSNTSDVDVSYNLKVVATDTVSTDTANRTNTYTSYHREDLSVLIVEDVNAGCTWPAEDPPGCTATADYSTTVTGTPTSYAWVLSEITGGSAVILSGQGTGSIVVQTVGTTTVGYKLTCQITSEFQTAQDSQTFSQTHAEESTGPAFYALTPDPLTYEMKGVLTGTGDLTTTHTASVYAQDFEDIYREFAANEPVWTGGRVVRNLLYYSDLSVITNGFGNGDWNIGTNTLTGGQADPNGGTDAYTFTAVVGNAQIRQILASWGTNIGVNSVWIRRKTGSGVVLLLAPDTSALDITAQLTGAWQRFSASATRDGQPRFAITVVDIGDEVDICYPQLELTSGNSDTTLPAEYVETNSTASVVTTFANQNGNTVTNNVVTEAVGTPLAEVPYLDYYPAAQNELLHSRDFATATNWTPTGCTAVADAVGLDGTPNTGVTVTGTGNTSDKINPSSIAGTIQSTGVLYYRKTGTDATHVLFQPHQSQWVEFNPQDGTEIHTQGIASWDWIDQGDVVKVVVEANGGVDSIYNVYPNRSGGAASIVLLQMERHQSKSLAEVRGLGPIFTTTAPVVTDRTLYLFDLANHDNVLGAYYIDYLPSYNGSEVLSIQPVMVNTVTSSQSVSGWVLNNSPSSLYSRGLSGNSVLTKAVVQDQNYKLGNSYAVGDDTLTLNVDGVWGSDTAFTGFNVSGGSNKLGVQSSSENGLSYKLRELQRYDINSYAEGKTIIDGLMS